MFETPQYSFSGEGGVDTPESANKVSYQPVDRALSVEILNH
jgi:hypothetical protein